MDEPSNQLQEIIAKSKRVELPFTLVESGYAIFPSGDEYSTLLKLFPNTFAVEVRPPYLIIRVHELPLKPWPFTIGGLPVQFTRNDHGEIFKRGRIGRGKVVLPDLNLKGSTKYSNEVLRAVIDYFEEVRTKIRDVFWMSGCWLVTTIEEIDIKLLPAQIGRCPTWYRTVAENPDPDPAALSIKAPKDFDYDDSNYVTTSDTLLRPGIMLSSSAKVTSINGQIEDSWKSTTSGILVVNRVGELFITVASHGFEDDGLVYHPDPKHGKVIGKIVASLPHTDISMVKLNTGLRYVNVTFGNDTEPDGTIINGLAVDRTPHMRSYDDVTMNNPFSGHCNGAVLATGARITGEGDKRYVLHDWYVFENGQQAADGSCGSAVLDAQGGVAGMFRFKQQDSGDCLCVAAVEMREFGYEIC